MSNSRRGLTARQPLGPKRGRADLKHLRALTEAEIRKTAAGAREPAARFLEGRRTREARSTRKTEALATRWLPSRLTVRGVPHNTSVDNATQLLYPPFVM